MLRITLNRPESLNSLDEQVLLGIADVLGEVAGDPSVKAVRLDGAGRAFSSGGSISADDLSAASARPPDELIEAANRAVRAIVSTPQPVVAAVHGPAVGGGAALAMTCDLVIASEAAFFMFSATKIGLMPDAGTTAVVAAAAGRIRAMQTALLAQRISAAEALQWGLVTAVYPPDRFDAEVDGLIATLVASPAAAFRRTKAAVNAAAFSQLDSALEREKRGQSALLEAPEFAEGARAFQQRRAPRFTDS
jgi:enoyl-CoA hydratase